jgi:hypothetical protein
LPYFHWHTIRGELLQTFNKQDYTFLPLNMVTKADGETLHLWSSQEKKTPFITIDVFIEVET